MKSLPTRRRSGSPRALARGLVLMLALAVGLRPPAIAQELPTLGEAGAEDLTPSQERQLGEQIMVEVRADKSYLPIRMRPNS